MARNKFFNKLGVLLFLPIIFGGVQRYGTFNCPEGMVKIPGLNSCIDVYEWPNKKGQKILIGASAIPEDIDIKSGIVMDADTLCQSVGKRPCVKEEWVASCKGIRGPIVDWSSDKKSVCNTDKKYRGVPDERKIHTRDEEVMNYLDQSDLAGERSNCKSSSGAMDMVGNAEEWVKCDGKYGWCLMGRFWSDAKNCEYAVSTHSPNWHYYQSSFRCCKD